jgi:hypothetical protein
MNWRMAHILFLAGSVLSGAAATAGPAVATKWRMAGESRNDCMGHAMESIKRAGFEMLDPGSQSMLGKRGDYTASIRCIAEQRIVFFVMSGPSPDATARNHDVLYAHF